MSFRLPQTLGPRDRNDALTAIDVEVGAEKAANLGRMGKRVETTLAALRAFDGPPAARPALVRDAAEAVWEFFIQRELCGLYDQSRVIADFGIPREVLVRLGER